MTTFYPILRVTVRAPRSQDATEAAILTGIGTIHSDEFKVATAEVAGFKGYLEWPQGRRGRIDFKSRTTDVAQLTFRVVDKQLTPGGSQAIRWVSGFPGGASGDGRTRWRGCKWETEISLDNGATWNPWFTGRIVSVDVEAGMADFKVQGMTRDLVRAKVFTGRPHSSITYISETSLIPVGITVDWGTVAGATALAGAIGAPTNGSGTGRSILVASGSVSNPANFVTRAFRWNDGRSHLVARGAYTKLRPYPRDREARVRLTHAGGTGDFRILGYKMFHKPEGHYAIAELWIEALPVGTANYLAMPADATAVTWKIQTALREPTSKTPLFIGDVHRIQLAADILDGKFGDLNPDGSIRRSWPRNGAQWAPFLADPSWGTVRDRIEKPWEPLPYIEGQLGRTKGFCLRENAAGQLELVDLRLPSTLSGIPTVTEDDLDAETQVRWSEGSEDAISKFAVKYRLDDVIRLDELQDLPGFFPDIPACLIESFEADPPYEERFLGTADAGEQTLTIDASTLRVSLNETGDVLAQASGGGMSRLEVVEGECRDLLRQYEKPFATGAQYLRFSTRRTATTDALLQGGLALTAFSAQLNPGTNQRGGTLLVRILEKSERGGRYDWVAVCIGPGVVASTPTLGAPGAGTDTRHELTTAITLDANSDPVVVQVALTAKSVGSAPADGDPKWVTVGRVTTSSTLTVRNQPAGYRAWVRGRSEPRPDSLNRALPSPWVAAGGVGYRDLADITAPATLAVSGITSKVAILTIGLGGNTTDALRILIGQGASQAAADASTPTRYGQDLPAGTTKYTLYGLDELVGPWFRVQVLFVDGAGGVSAATGTSPISFQATGAAAVAPALAGVQVLNTTPLYGVTAAKSLPGTEVGGSVRMGVVVNLLPGTLGFDIECERAPDSGGSPGAWAQVDKIPATLIFQEGYVWANELPADDTFRWYRFRHSGAGHDAGIYTNPFQVKPAPLPRQSLPRLAPGPIARERPLAGGARSVLQLQSWLWPNAEFDLWEADGVTPAGWAVDLTGGAVVSRVATPDSGDYALRYKNPDNGTNGGWHGLSTLDPIKGAFCMPLRPGTKYRLLIKSKASVVANGQRFRVVLDYGTGGTYTKELVYQDLGHSAGAYGALFEIPITVPANADPNTKGTAQFNRNGNGSDCEFDLDSIRADEETADYELLSQQIQDQGYAISVNGDFERGRAFWEEYKGTPSASVLSVDTSVVDKGTRSLKVSVTANGTQTLIQQSRRTTDEDSKVLDTATDTVLVTRVSTGDLIQVRGRVRKSASGPSVKLGLRRWSGPAPSGAGTATALTTSTSASDGAFEELNAIYQVVAGTAWVAPYLQIDGQNTDRTVNFDDLVWGRLLQLPCAKATRTSGTLGVLNNTNTPVTFDAEDYDVGGFHSTSSNTDRLTIPNAGGAFDGVVDLIAQVKWPNDTGGYRRLQILKNGAATPIAEVMADPVAADHAMQIAVSIRNPVPGDYFQVYAFQTSGGTLNLVNAGCWFSLAYRR